LAIADYDLAVGNPANVVILNAPDAFTAIRFQVTPRYVISHGKIIAETQPAQTIVNLSN
jgi:cytosine/creatinine deaminase